jgi:AraC-like DNA-binding protein
MERAAEKIVHKLKNQQKIDFNFKISDSNKYIYRHLIESIYNDDFRVDDLYKSYKNQARKFGIEFRIKSGQTIENFIVKKRIELALALINQFEVNDICYLVTDIAWNVGYSNPSTFSNAFKRIVNISPSSYIKHKRMKNLKQNTQ